jgi:zinc protease
MRAPLVLLLVAATLPAAAAERPPAPPKPVHLPVTTFKLGNGLTVLVHEDHTVPLCAVDVWYHVGSKDERAGRTGFAHLFEHMMFQGSAHVGDDEHLRLVAEAGGEANGTTNLDRTNYFETFPSNFLDRMLFLESDRMGFLLDTLTQEKLDNQREVVLNERRQSYENRPYGMVPFAIADALYPPDHPYRHPTIGERKDIESATLDEVKEFFRAWYTPANASVAIVGDVTPARARELAEKYFGALPSHAPPEHRVAPPVKLEADKRVELEDRVALERLYLVWPSPPLFKPGDAELDLLATVLGGRSGRLYKRLVHELQVAQDVQVHQASGMLASEFRVVVTAKPGHTAAEMEKLVQAELAQLTSSAPLTREELERAKNQWDAAFVYGLEGVGQIADQIGSYYYHLGRGDGFDDDRKRYIDATLPKVQAEAARILGEHRVTVTVKPARAPAKEAK